MARIMVVFGRDEIQRKLAYPLICETMGSARWETGKRRRLWVAQFTKEERRKCYGIKAQADRWHLKKGVPDKVRMSLDTYFLWQKLEAFCAAL